MLKNCIPVHPKDEVGCAQIKHHYWQNLDPFELKNLYAKYTVFPSPELCILLSLFSILNEDNAIIITKLISF